MNTTTARVARPEDVERSKVLRRLTDVGFTDEQAWALATSRTTVFLVPVAGAR